MNRKSNKGAALLELVFVMALLVVILVALVSLVVFSLSTIQKSRLRSRASAIAEQGVENVRAKRDEYLNSSIKTWDNFKDDCKSSISSIDWSGSFDDEGGIFSRVETCVDAPAEKVKVTMTVNWTFGGTPSSVILETEFGRKKDSIYR
jgi:Tfp pilus assembly protein PilV